MLFAPLSPPVTVPSEARRSSADEPQWGTLVFHPVHASMTALDDPQIFRTVLDSLQAGVCLTDPENRILFWNEGAERITGYHRHDVVGHYCHQNILPNCDGRACAFCGAACPLARTLHDGKSTHARLDLRHKEGHRITIRVWFVPLRDEHGSVVGVAQSFDRQIHVTDERRQHNLATYGCLDDVTGIPNHGFTEFHLRENLESFAKYHLPFGVLLIQVDALEHFQQAYGREAGDSILRVIAQTMRNTLRPTDFLGRWQGAEFLAILMNSTNAGVSTAGERIRKLVGCAGLQWWGDELMVTASLGTASAQAGDTIESMLERAHQALQHSSAKTANAATAAAGSSSSTGR
jgi:diguanylate cyclase (GGDEF)-like protein/PAS domain S-box-containing protein